MQEKSNDASKASAGTGITPGQIAFGKFKIVRCIGTGGMGSVYESINLDLDKTVAIKILNKHWTEPQSALRFQNEARMASSLQHKNIATIYDFGKSEDDRLYMSMEFVPGKTVDQLLREKKRLDLIDVLDIAIQVTAALQHAHRNGVVHRDIKPSNIMIFETDSHERGIKVLDFGIAKRFNNDGGVLTLTPAGQLMGTPLYMSPEQCRHEPLKESSDLYSLGCVMFECLTGRPPFQGTSVMETLILHQEGSIPSVKKALDTEFADQVNELVSNLLSKSESERWSASEANERLEDLYNKVVSNEDATSENANQDRVSPVETTSAVFPGDTEVGGMKPWMLASGLIGVLLISGWISYIFNSKPPEMDKSASPERRETKESSGQSDEDRLGLKDQIEKNMSNYLNLQFTTPLSNEDLKLFDNGKLRAKNIQIDLSDSYVTDAGLFHLRNLDIVSLKLNGNKHLTPLTNLSKIRSLKELELNYTDVGDGSIENLKQLKQLEKLELIDTKVTYDKVRALPAALPSASRILVLQCKKITNEQFIALENQFPFCQFRTNPSAFQQLKYDYDAKRISDVEAERRIDELLRRRDVRPNSLGRIQCLTLKGNILRSMNRLDEAQECFLEVANQWVESGFDLTSSHLTSFTTLIDVYRQTGQLKAASELTHRWYSRIKQRFGEKSVVGEPILRRIADVYLAEKKVDQALSTYLTCAELLAKTSPFNDEQQLQTEQLHVFSTIAIIFDKKGETKKSTFFHKKCMGLTQVDNRLRATVYRKLGNLSFQAQEYARASEYYNQCLRLYDFREMPAELGQIYLELADVDFRQNKMNESRLSYEKALTLYEMAKPKDFALIAQMRLALAGTLKSDAKEAEAIYRKALEDIGNIRNPKNRENLVAHYYIAFGNYSTHCNKWNDAIANYKLALTKKALLKKEELAYVYLSLGDAQLASRKSEEAIPNYQSSVALFAALKKDREVDILNFKIGQCYQSLNRFEPAIIAFQKSVGKKLLTSTTKLENQDMYSLVTMAYCETQIGRLQDASNHLDQALRLIGPVNKSNEELFVQIYLFKAQVALQQKQIKQAFDLNAKALQYCPANAALRKVVDVQRTQIEAAH